MRDVMAAPAPRILVVDDDSDTRTSLRVALEGLGCTVVDRSSGRKALNYLTSDEPMPEVIVLDLGMPDMNGWELIFILARYVRFAGIPVILVSGMVNEIHHLHDQVTAYFPKPIDTERFLGTVAHEIRRVQEKRALAPADRF
jgi:two-component system, OmpR family, KDP operon response regulator KdpE